jgi:hypothetical protein
VVDAVLERLGLMVQPATLPVKAQSFSAALLILFTESLSYLFHLHIIEIVYTEFH